MRSIRTEILTFSVATLAHAAAIFALAAFDESAQDAHDESAPLILEFFAETPAESEAEPERNADETPDAGTPAVAADALPAENSEDAEPRTTEIESAALPPIPVPESEPPQEILTESAHDAAAGDDGNTRGDGIDADKTLGVPAPQENSPKNPESESAGNAPEPPPPEETQERGGGKIGKRGDPTAGREGDFGSGGNGIDGTATVRYRRRVAPKYPRADALAGRGGTVVLLLEIDERGTLTGVRVKRSSGSPSLDAAAIRAARASEYLPARDGSRAVPSRAEVNYTFAR